MNDAVFYAITIMVLLYLAYSVIVFRVDLYHPHHPIVPEPWDIGNPSAQESYLLMTEEE